MTAANPNLHAAVAEDPILGLSAFELAQKIHAREPVSYTHLTLPTSDLV